MAPPVDQVMKKAKYVRANMELREAKLLMQTSQGGWTTKRCEYFRGKTLVKFLMDKKTKAPYRVETEAEAVKLGALLLRKMYKGAPLVHRSDVHDKKKRILRAQLGNKEFTPDGYYCWIYEGSQIKRNILTALVVGGFVSCVMFPIWPAFLKVIVWYISVTLLILLLSIIVIRLVVFCSLWGIGFDCWIVPNLFADDLGIVDSFLPLYTFSKAEDWESTKMFRFAMLGMVLSCAYWVYIQPTEFDEFVMESESFLDELYNGNLLSDVSQESKENIDRVVPNLEDLENMDVDGDDDATGTVTYQHDVDEAAAEEDEVDAMMAKMLESEDDDLGSEVEDPYAVEGDEEDE